MSIRLKLVLLIAVPVLALVALGMRGVVQGARVAGEMGDVRELSDLAVRASA